MNHVEALTYGIDERETTISRDPQIPINVSAVRHRSPFRYPGGKTWLVPHIKQWLWSLNAPVERFIEPFAGGAIVGLSALLDRFTYDLTLLEKDINVAAVWQTIANGDALELGKRIASFDLTEENVHKLLEKELAPSDILGRAFITIIRNRIQRGGILAPGASVMRNGENGRGIKSRWYPETLEKRLVDLHHLHAHIDFQAGDGIEYMRSNANEEGFVWFIDPPYTVAGRRLYLHSQVDHTELFRVTSDLRGPFLMTYDDSLQIRELSAKYGFHVRQVAMKNSHHTVMKELLISSDFDWLHD